MLFRSRCRLSRRLRDLLHRVSPIVVHHPAQPVVDRTVLLGVEGPPVSAYPFGAYGPIWSSRQIEGRRDDK